MSYPVGSRVIIYKSADNRFEYKVKGTVIDNKHNIYIKEDKGNILINPSNIKLID